MSKNSGKSHRTKDRSWDTPSPHYRTATGIVAGAIAKGVKAIRARDRKNK